MAAVMFAIAMMFAVPVFGHHSIAAEFDNSRGVLLEGRLTRLDWTNPHVWVYLDSKDDEGALVKWRCESGAPNSFLRDGWSNRSFKVGSRLIINGWPAKDGSRTCMVRSVKLPDGTSIYSRNSNQSRQ